MLVARRVVSPAWSHNSISLLVDLTPRVKFRLDATEHKGCFQASMLSTGSFAGQQFFIQPHQYSTGR